MTDSEILDKVTLTLRDILFQPELTLTPETTANHVEGWDSLSHIQIIVALERDLGFRFTAAEISDLPNVGALIKTIQAKLPR